MTRRQMPPRGHVRSAAPGFGDHLARHEQPELDANPRESDSLPACLGARGNVVIPRQLPSLHTAPIVHDRQRRISRVGEKADARRAGVERVRYGFGENCLFKGAGVRVPQIFEQVLEVDSGLAHACMLSPAAPPSSTHARANVESVQPIHTPGFRTKGAVAVHSRTFHDDA